MSPLRGLTDAHIACILRAARAYRVQLGSEIQRLQELANFGSIVAKADLETHKFEAACLTQAIQILWKGHAEVTNPPPKPGGS